MSLENRITTNAIILRTYLSGENALVIKAFSEDIGKISIYGKGLKGNKKSQIEIIDLYYLELKKNKNSDLFYLAHRRPITSFSNIRTNLKSISLTSLVLESFDNLIGVDEETFSEGLFNDLKNYLEKLNSNLSLKEMLQETYFILKILLNETGYLSENLREKGSKNQLLQIMEDIEVNSEKRLNSKSSVENILARL